MIKKMPLTKNVKDLFYKQYPSLAQVLDVSTLLEGLLKNIPEPRDSMDKVKYTKLSYNIVANTAFYFASQFNEVFQETSEKQEGATTA